MNFDRIADTIAQTKTGKYRSRRHHDDEYWDEIVVKSSTASLRTHARPYYKTSGLSGSEWRVRGELEVFIGDTRIEEISFTALKWAIQFTPHILWMRHKNLLLTSQAKITIFRKKNILWSGAFDTFGDAGMGLWWHIVHANESDTTWNHLTDDQERKHCQQVSCSLPPVNVFEFLKIQEYPNADLTNPEYDWTPRFTWFCANHSTRGDCGLEDADRNLVLIDGPGTAGVHSDDEVPSVLGGIGVVDLE